MNFVMVDPLHWGLPSDRVGAVLDDRLSADDRVDRRRGPVRSSAIMRWPDCVRQVCGCQAYGRASAETSAMIASKAS
jgi:hypothetical protein